MVTTMRHMAPCALAVALLVALLCVGGCQSPRITVSDVPTDEQVAIPPAQSHLTFHATPPPNWVPKPTGAFLLARFDIPIQTDRVDASVSMLSGNGGGLAGGLLGNINRWRGQLGLPALATAPPLQTVSIHRIVYQLVVIRHTPQSMAVYMHTKGDHTWFFKVVGPSQHLAAAQTAMETYLKGGQWH